MSQLTTYPLRIGDEWRSGDEHFQCIDPYTGQPFALVAEAAERDVADAVRAARAAFDDGPWSWIPGRERAALLRRLADLIREHGEELALLETQDNGKLLRENRGQMAGLPGWYEYFAGLADKIDGRVVDTGRSDYFGFVTREPVGVVAAVVPWNSPLLLFTWKLAPALAAGCTVVVKPSEQAAVSIMRFMKLVEEAGFPPGVVNAVAGANREIGRWLVEDPGVDHVSFTGSDVTGSAVARSAAGHHAGLTLELGGKSANLVFPDADPEAAANGLIAGIFAAAGQTCIAGSRALIHRDVYEDVVGRVVKRAESIVMGDPKAPETELGPICFPGQHERIKSYVEDAVRSGAQLRAGGTDRGLGGTFFEPTVIAEVTNEWPVCQDELFGPVLSVLPFESEEEALRLANDSRFGLAAGIWTADISRGLRMSRALKVGIVWINSYRTSGYAMPFGGRKGSGYGRENGIEGLNEYLVDKAVWIETTGATRDPFVLG